MGTAIFLERNPHLLQTFKGKNPQNDRDLSKLKEIQDYLFLSNGSKLSNFMDYRGPVTAPNTSEVSKQMSIQSLRYRTAAKE